LNLILKGNLIYNPSSGIVYTVIVPFIYFTLLIHIMFMLLLLFYAQ